MQQIIVEVDEDILLGLKIGFNWSLTNHKKTFKTVYLTIIIPRAWMVSESIAHEAFSLMGYWLRDHEGERNNCFSKIQLVGQIYRDETTLAGKTRFSRHCFGFQNRRFSLLVGYNI